MKETYLSPTAQIIICECEDIVTVSDPYIDDIDWEL